MEIDLEENASGSIGMEVDDENENIQWRIAQVKGHIDNDDAPNDADIISCLEFSPDGELLAAGNKAGHVAIFQRSQKVRF